MMEIRKIATVCTLISTTAIVSAVTPLWLRDVKISPNGKNIAFTYAGDIWTVDSNGGKAHRLTNTDKYYEDHPIWSPDSKKIAFSSDRTGNFDIFIVDSEGGNPTRLTYNSANEIPETFTADGSAILFSAAIQDQNNSVSFPSSRMTELYQISKDGGNPIQISGIPIQMPSFSKNQPDIIYFQDCKGMEDEWRKHHVSSVTRDIWKWDRVSNSYSNITNRPGEDRNPAVSPDGTTLYFLRENPGESMNVFSLQIPTGEITKVTDFTNHPVRFLSISDEGKMAFAYDGEIYTFIPGQQPQKIDVDITADITTLPEKIDIRGIEEAVPSPDGKSVAFISRGDVFVTSTDYSTTKQITNTPQAESGLVWSPDGTYLTYTSERDGFWNLYRAKKGRKEEPNFENATIIIEESVFPTMEKSEKTFAQYSPDGKKLAYIKDRNRLVVYDIEKGTESEILDGSTYYSRNGGFDYQWSPDGQWIVAEGILHKHDPYSDIFLVNINDKNIIPLTETGYFDQSPKFAFDGNAVIFLSDRYGMRSHASWGSQKDVIIVFLNEEAYDRYTLSEEDYKLKKELEKSNKSDKKEEKEKGKTSKDIKPIVVEPQNIQKRTRRLTPFSANIADAIITNDGETLYYMPWISKGFDLWKINLREKKNEEAKKMNAHYSHFVTDKDGNNIFIVAQNAIKKLEPKGEKLTNISFNGKMKLDRAAERNYMFDYVKRQEREMFYDTAMHGVDWETLTEHYRKFLPHITTNYDFSELLSEMLGELNVSHTGGRYTPPANPNASKTASLGLLYDMTYDGEGLLVTEIIPGGAMDKSWSKIEAGDIIVAINNDKIDNTTDKALFFNDIENKKTLVTYIKPNGDKIEEVVIPDTRSKESSLLYDRWVKQRAADVDEWSNGRLGYVHIKSMGDPSYRDIYADILGKYNDKDGIVIDIRWNGGGRLHEDIEILFSGDKYFTQVVRGKEACDMPSRRWNKPSIMLQAEPCYSNAHGTPWVYKHKGIGKLVGAPVPGTMTSVNWVHMQDPTMIFGIPVTGYRLPDGSYLENTQLEPDVYVLNTPADIMNNYDRQLHTAVKELLQEIDAQKQ